MDKKQLIGFVLIFGLLMAINFINKPSKEEIERNNVQDSLALVQKKTPVRDTESAKTLSDAKTIAAAADDTLADAKSQLLFGSLASFSKGQEKEFKLENEDIEVTFSNKGGRIKNVRLKKYESWLEDKDHKKLVNPIELLNYPADKFEYILPVSGAQNNNVNSSELFFEVSESNNEINFRVDSKTGVVFSQTYKLDPKGYKIDYQINQSGLNLSKDDKLTLKWEVYLKGLEKALQYEKTYTTLYYKDAKDVDHLSFSSNDEEKEAISQIEWVSNVNQFFNSTLMKTDQQFQNAKFEVAVPGEDEVTDYIKICKTRLEFPETENFKMQFYVGPNEFKALKAFENDLEMVVSFGWNIFGAINRWVIRPMFLFLFDIVGSMGLAIIILIFIIKGLLSPLNHKMLLSSSKMQALKPEIDKLKEKHKDDAQQIQLKTMELYRKYGVSPFGGCLPMLLQMPIWIALFRFFPAAIEFRQVPFLWAPDLSSYESIAYLPFNIPMYGSHVSLFALLWGISSVIYAHYNMKNMDMGTSQNQAMKYMQYIMPVFFIVFFNSYASGLNVYMFFSNLFTILQTTITKRFFIDEEKIRAKLELQKEKPKKKSKFTQRLEDAMKQQQELAEKKKKGK
ncbi:MAG: membrane protein insertase YidC [Saprospiraceae bacterium]|nr:membrane protein insertase YidC [Saprospiraceae bacterium]